MDQDTSESTRKQDALIELTKPLKLQWKELLVKHREEELIQRGRKFRMQVELENWLNKYDDFMEGQNMKIDVIQEEYDLEKADFNELSARFAVLKSKSRET